MGLVRFKGQLYAALTSSAIMAGGRFEAFYGVGNISAQFNVALDFIISWLPFFYDARFSVSVSMKVSLWLFDLKATISTDLHIWGPEFAGHAKVNLKIYTAKFDFGASKQLKKAPVSWNEFNSTFLPEQADILKTHLTQGLISEKKVDDTLWHIVEPDQFELKIESQLPVNQIICDTIPEWNEGNSYLKGNQVTYSSQVYQAKQEIAANTVWNSENWEQLAAIADTLTGNSFSIAPMGGKQVSNWTLNVKCIDSPSGMKFEVTPEEKPMPVALWGDNMKPDIKGPTKKSLLSGVIVRSLASEPPGATEEVDADEFKFQDVVENDPFWQWQVEYVVTPGNALNEWVSGTTYSKGDCVTYNDGIYQCIVGTSSATNFTRSSWKSFDAILVEGEKETIQTDITNTAQRDKVADFFGYQNESMDVHRMATDLDTAFIGTPQIMQKASKNNRNN
jgi:chitodextrinase